MKKAKAQRRAKLPLEDPRWWDWGRAIEHVRQVRLNHAIADQELATAINGRHVSCKMEWLDRRTDPPKRGAMLLEDSFFAAFRIKPGWGKLLSVSHRSDVRVPRDHVMYAWGPEIERIWPTAAPTTTQVREGQSKPGSADAWIDFLFPDDEWRLLTPKQIHDAIAKHAKDKGWKTFPSYSAVAAAVAKRSI